MDSIKAGATFDSIVTAQGKTAADTLLGTFAKDKVPDPAVAEAAFALQANEVSPIVDGAFGPVLVRVTAITPAGGEVARRGDARNPQGSGAGRSQPHPARRA